MSAKERYEPARKSQPISACRIPWQLDGRIQGYVASDSSAATIGHQQSVARWTALPARGLSKCN